MLLCLLWENPCGYILVVPGFQGVLDNAKRKKFLVQFFNMVADNLLPLHLQAGKTSTAEDKDEAEEGKSCNRVT